LKPAFILPIVLITFTHSCFAANSLPGDVRRFIDRRLLCDHIRGEVPEPGDVERMKEIEDGITRRCTGSDKKLKALKKKYAANTVVMSHLSTFEAEIEEK
jgi:hypothetical protein